MLSSGISTSLGVGVVPGAVVVVVGRFVVTGAVYKKGNEDIHKTSSLFLFEALET